MSGRMLLDLPDVVRAAGLVMHLEPGWETRARSSGGYSSGRPNHVMVHHTASHPSSDGQADCNYCCYVADAKPLANLLLARTGEVWVMAAGATNTNGSGTCPHCGLTDQMNSAAIGIEAANDGVGEPWPVVQQDAYIALTAQLLQHYQIDLGATQLHAGYAPSRKVDAAGPSRWSPHPTGGGGGNTWRLDAFHADVLTAMQPAPTPEPPPLEEDIVPYLLLSHPSYPDDNYALFASGAVRKLKGNAAEWRWYGGQDVPAVTMTDADEINHMRKIAT